MENPRRHGQPPFRVAVLHGGPGAGGEMAPVARELARRRGVLEPIQTATTLEDQVRELDRQLEAHAEPGATLIGWSWGAWLALLLAADRPRRVGRLVLVSSGPFEERYVVKLRETRSERLAPAEREEFDGLLLELAAPGAGSDESLERLGEICARTDAFDPIPWETRGADAVPCDAALFQKVWDAAALLRRSGELLERARRVRCPVVAIHGDHDPHPAEGVRDPLSAVLADFRFELLERCGHTPWLERQARGAFLDRLEGALSTS